MSDNSYSNMTTQELIKKYNGYREIIEVRPCYNTSDLLNREAIARELQKRGFYLELRPHWKLENETENDENGNPILINIIYGKKEVEKSINKSITSEQWNAFLKAWEESHEYQLIQPYCSEKFHDFLWQYFEINEPKMFVIMEEGDAIEGNGVNEKLVTWDSIEEAEQAIKDFVKDYQEADMEYTVENFSVMPLTPYTKLRDGLTLTKEQEEYIKKFKSKEDSCPSAPSGECSNARD